MNVRDATRGTVALTVIVCVMSINAGRSEARVSGPTLGATVQVGQLGPFIPATFTDRNTGVEYSVAMFATATEPGVGTVSFALSDTSAFWYSTVTRPTPVSAARFRSARASAKRPLR